MTNRILLYVFFICLLSCSSLVISAIWTGGMLQQNPIYFQITATLFIIGLVSFLTWFVRIAHTIYLKLTGKC